MEDTKNATVEYAKEVKRHQDMTNEELIDELVKLRNFLYARRHTDYQKLALISVITQRLAGQHGL